MSDSGVSALVFDLDGVLVDSDPAWAEARTLVLAREGAAWDPALYPTMMGMTPGESIAKLKAHYALTASVEDLSEAIEKLVETSLTNPDCRALAAGAMLRRLSRWYRLGIASCSSQRLIDAAARALRITDCLGARVSCASVGAGKPAPDVYLAAVSLLGVRPGETVAVEDSTSGILAAHGAGLRVVAIPNRRFPPASRALALAEQVIASVLDLEAWLDAIDDRATLRT